MTSSYRRGQNTQYVGLGCWKVRIPSYAKAPTKPLTFLCAASIAFCLFYSAQASGSGELPCVKATRGDLGTPTIFGDCFSPEWLQCKPQAKSHAAGPCAVQ